MLKRILKLPIALSTRLRSIATCGRGGRVGRRSRGAWGVEAAWCAGVQSVGGADCGGSSRGGGVRPAFRGIGPAGCGRFRDAERALASARALETAVSGRKTAESDMRARALAGRFAIGSELKILRECIPSSEGCAYPSEIPTRSSAFDSLKEMSLSTDFLPETAKNRARTSASLVRRSVRATTALGGAPCYHR